MPAKRKGGAARDLVRGKRWLLLSSWLNLDRGKRRQLNTLFALNRRILKAYLLKESLSQLWNYTYEVPCCVTCRVGSTSYAGSD
jgi:hypothetical protein